MNSQKQMRESVVAGRVLSEKNIVKKSHWRIAETMLAALSFVYLKDWVILFILRSFSSSRKRFIKDISPVRSKGKHMVWARNQFSQGKIFFLEKLFSVRFIMNP